MRRGRRAGRRPITPTASAIGAPVPTGRRLVERVGPLAGSGERAPTPAGTGGGTRAAGTVRPRAAPRRARDRARGRWWARPLVAPAAGAVPGHGALVGCPGAPLRGGPRARRARRCGASSRGSAAGGSAGRGSAARAAWAARRASAAHGSPAHRSRDRSGGGVGSGGTTDIGTVQSSDPSVVSRGGGCGRPSRAPGPSRTDRPPPRVVACGSTAPGAAVPGPGSAAETQRSDVAGRSRYRARGSGVVSRRIATPPAASAGPAGGRAGATPGRGAVGGTPDGGSESAQPGIGPPGRAAHRGLRGALRRGNAVRARRAPGLRCAARSARRRAARARASWRGPACARRRTRSAPPAGPSCRQPRSRVRLREQVRAPAAGRSSHASRLGRARTGGRRGCRPGSGSRAVRRRPRPAGPRRPTRCVGAARRAVQGRHRCRGRERARWCRRTRVAQAVRLGRGRRPGPGPRVADGGRRAARPRRCDAVLRRRGAGRPEPRAPPCEAAVADRRWALGGGLRVAAGSARCSGTVSGRTVRTG